MLIGEVKKLLYVEVEGDVRSNGGGQNFWNPIFLYCSLVSAQFAFSDGGQF